MAKSLPLADFNPSVLGLGDLTQASVRIEAMAAVFDLGGFTHFCKQVDPHLSVPTFLSQFLEWLMEQLKQETVVQNESGEPSLYHPLPFFIKFMGDGVLILWNCEGMTSVHIHNVVVTLYEICQSYQARLLPSLRSLVVDPPVALRCGIARGTIFSVGDGRDFVGSCINIAGRLQKLPGVNFAINIRGVDIKVNVSGDFLMDRVSIKKVSIRGIGETELVAVLNSDLAAMTPEERKLYKAPQS